MRHSVRVTTTMVLTTLGLVGCGDGDENLAGTAKKKATTTLGTTEAESNDAKGDSAVAADALEHHYLHGTEKPHLSDWTYSGDSGPQHWGDLCPEYALATTGKQQSPIDIANATPQELPEIRFRYEPAKINLVYNGHTIEEMEEEGSSVDVGGAVYQLKQFHFHSPSEHTVDGKRFAMEMHLVHTTADGDVAVVAVLIKEGERNDAFAAIWDFLPTEENKKLEAERTVDAARLLPIDHTYFRYRGSFTTPPCTEGVLWMVLTTPVELSAERIAAFRKIIDGNNRPVQPLNGREIVVKK